VPEARPFRPHVTVARARQPARVAAKALDIPPLDRDVSIDAVTVFRSHLNSPHPRYEPIARLGLQGRPVAG
jgi:2'-5' RNA ligase